jgi:cytochrome b subunit of formate dehydrogenase
MTRVVMYTRFERFWHWATALLILGMLITGFEVHGTYHLLGFEQAADLHIPAATNSWRWFATIWWIFFSAVATLITRPGKAN